MYALFKNDKFLRLVPDNVVSTYSNNAAMVAYKLDTNLLSKATHYDEYDYILDVKNRLVAIPKNY